MCMRWKKTMAVMIFLSGLALNSCNRADAENLTPNPDPPAENARPAKVVHLHVALCDNESQGILPVPSRIGNGDDPASNLYWGCSDGAMRYFGKSKLWTKIKSVSKPADKEILERLVFRHKRTGAVLVVDAWRGSEIKACIKRYCRSLAGQHYESLSLDVGGKTRRFNIGGGADLHAFIGHNGLMEFTLPAFSANPKRKKSPSAVVLCCQSDVFFSKYLSQARAKPVLMTASNMYPGAFLLHDALEGWFKGESQEKIRLRAAKAYAKNQKIKVKGALTVFAKPRKR